MSLNGRFPLSADITEREKKEIKDALKDGYKQNGKFNKEYAEMCLCADNDALALCEEKLSECE